MDFKLSYYNTGDDFFKPGEAIYINKATEKSEPHLHAHNFIEIAYVCAGYGIHKIGESEYPVAKGDLFIINYDVPHEFRSLTEYEAPRLIVYNCVLKPEFIDFSLVNCHDFMDITHHFLFRSLFPEEAGKPVDIKLLGNESKEIEELYEKMLREYTMQQQGYIEIIRAYVIELLVMVFRLYRKSEKADVVENQRKLLIDNVIGYLKDNYSQDLKLEDISVMAFLSRNYFCKLFKECTGMTVVEYMQSLRIQEACRLLKNTDRKVIDIAADVGYRDLKFFSQIFKRKTGKTPGGYRKDVS